MSFENNFAEGYTNYYEVPETSHILGGYPLLCNDSHRSGAVLPICNTTAVVHCHFSIITNEVYVICLNNDAITNVSFIIKNNDCPSAIICTACV